MKSKIEKLVEILKHTDAYSTEEYVQKNVDTFEKMNGLEDTDSLDLHNAILTFVDVNNLEADFKSAEAIYNSLVSMNEAEGDDEDIDSEGSSDVNLDIDSEDFGKEGDDLTVEDAVEEDEDIESEDVPDDNFDKRMKVQELEDNLRQIDTNINKIKELDTNEQLEELYLQELGKKYLIEDELSRLGSEKADETVHKAISDIFENKSVEGRKLVNPIKVRKNFNENFMDSRKTGKLFESIMVNHIVRSLNEGEVEISPAGIVMSKIDDNEEIFVKNLGQLSNENLGLVEDESGALVISVEDLPALLENIDDEVAINSDDVYLLVTEGNLFVSSLDEEEDFDLTADISDENILSLTSYEEALERASFIEQIMPFGVKPIRAIATPDGLSLMTSVVDNNDFFVLNESHEIGGVVLPAGHPCRVVALNDLERSFVSVSPDSGNQIQFVEDILFDEKLTAISESDYELLVTDKSIESDIKAILDNVKSKGYDVKIVDKTAGNSIYRFVEVSNSEATYSISSKIKDISADELDYYLHYNNDVPAQEAIRYIEENIEYLSPFFDKVLSGEIGENENMSMGDITAGVNNISLKDIDSGSELKVSKDVYLNEDFQITDDDFGGENIKILDANSVVKYYADKGLTPDNGENWYNIPEQYLVSFEKFDLNNLKEGQTYTIYDLRNSIDAEYVGCIDIDDTMFYEFYDVVNGESLHLTEDNVIYNIK